ncbi:MAG: helix-turn-helix transcriptional regulator [Clostridiales bacterium]|nr:helix-turn-helix transcriptional regulator [Clostridiales bacterium]
MAKQTIGEFLATLRKANGYTQQEIADRLGISNRTLSGWECNNVLPDILLLPALAELYGVTVDEILSGERKEKSEVELTKKSERRILKSKIARFTMQSSILVGIIIAGLVLTAACAFIEATKISWVGFPWWRVVLIVGAVATTICLSILFAFWKGAELSVDDTTDNYGLYCLVLRKKLANCLYILSAASAVATITLVVDLVVKINSSSALDVYYFFTKSVIVCVAFGVLVVALFVTAWLIYVLAVTNLGSEVHRQSVKKDRKYFGKVGIWGAIPLTLSVILAVVLTVVRPFENIIVYESDNVDEFVEYIESIATPNGYKHLQLSKLAKTAKIGEEFDLGDGYFAVYNLFSFTIYNEMIEVYVDGSYETGNVTFSIEAVRCYMAGDDNLSFFNARYYWLEIGNPFHFWFAGDDTDLSFMAPPRIDEKFVRYDLYSMARVGDGLSFYRQIGYDFSLIGYSVAFPVIVLDVIVCAALCVLKRNKFSVKL